MEGRDRTRMAACDGELADTEATPWFEQGDPAPPEDAAVAEVVEAAAEPPGEPIVVTREDMQSLPIDSGGLVVQPDRPWVLVNLDTIVMTGAQEQVIDTVVLGVPVRVRVLPVEYVWDFGDGSAPIVGTDPGAPWPDHTVAHAYTSPGSVRISLTTYWEGAFQPAGTATWLPVTGRAVTTESSDPLEVVTATPRLVRNP